MNRAGPGYRAHPPRRFIGSVHQDFLLYLGNAWADAICIFPGDRDCGAFYDAWGLEFLQIPAEILEWQDLFFDSRFAF